jgi:hypothetical protein
VEHLGILVRIRQVMTAETTVLRPLSITPLCLRVEPGLEGRSVLARPYGDGNKGRETGRILQIITITHCGAPGGVTPLQALCLAVSPA